MRILLITDLYPIENSGEPQTIKNFAKKWQELGHIVDVIRPNFLLNTVIRKKKIFPNKTYNEDGITIYNVNCITPFFFDVKNKLPKDFQIGNYNLVISHMPSGAMFAMKLIGKIAGIPYVASVHASDLQVLTKPLYQFLFAPALRKAYKRADAISARSVMLSEKIKQLSPFAVNKTFIAPSGIDKNIVEPAEYFEQKASETNRPFIIATTAKLIKRKNIDIIIKALKKLKDDNVVLRIMGDGKERKNLENLVKKLNLGEKVIFEGYLPNNEVLLKLRLSDMFILLSTGETFGMAYLEAASRANIVVATKNDGIDGLIKDGENGFTCEPDETKLAELIDKVMEMPRDEVRKILFAQRDFLLENDNDIAGKKYLDDIARVCGL
ncbi:MAG: glycosyltransferase [Candidatus Gastranaerophilales bacterium]|nr:glycosyltransferase [Candidatus Gastranaerophilales bacterium]